MVGHVVGRWSVAKHGITSFGGFSAPSFVSFPAPDFDADFSLPEPCNDKKKTEARSHLTTTTTNRNAQRRLWWNGGHKKTAWQQENTLKITRNDRQSKRFDRRKRPLPCPSSSTSAYSASLRLDFKVFNPETEQTSPPSALIKRTLNKAPHWPVGATWPRLRT